MAIYSSFPLSLLLWIRSNKALLNNQRLDSKVYPLTISDSYGRLIRHLQQYESKFRGSQNFLRGVDVPDYFGDHSQRSACGILEEACDLYAVLKGLPAWASFFSLSGITNGESKRLSRDFSMNKRMPKLLNDKAVFARMNTNNAVILTFKGKRTQKELVLNIPANEQADTLTVEDAISAAFKGWVIIKNITEPELKKLANWPTERSDADHERDEVLQIMDRMLMNVSSADRKRMLGYASLLPERLKRMVY